MSCRDVHFLLLQLILRTWKDRLVPIGPRGEVVLAAIKSLYYSATWLVILLSIFFAIFEVREQCIGVLWSARKKICTNSHFSLCLKVSISSLRLLWRQLLIVSNWQPPRSTKPYQVLMAVYQCIGQTGPSMVCIRVSQTEALQNQNQAPLFQDESHKVLSCWTIYLNQRWKK